MRDVHFATTGDLKMNTMESFRPETTGPFSRIQAGMEGYPLLQVLHEAPLSQSNKERRDPQSAWTRRQLGQARIGAEELLRLICEEERLD